MACENSSLDGYLYSLRMPTLAKLSHLLNPRKVLLSEEGHLRDWRGLAELMELDMLTIQNLEQTPNPFGALINQAKDLTVNQLIEFLEKMDRYDVVDDTIALMENDLYIANSEGKTDKIKQEIPQLVTVGDFDHLSKKGTLEEYDAFVLYAKEDQEFVNKVVEKMEGECGLKLCLKDRDLIAGLPFEHQAVTELISNRCRFVLPIFSPSFLNSEDNKYVVSFAEALGIERRCKKIIPCVYEKCDLPKSVSYITRLDFTRQNPWDMWDKMRKSLADPLAPMNEHSGKPKTAIDKSKKKEISTVLPPKGTEEPLHKDKYLPEVLPPVFADTKSNDRFKDIKLVREEPPRESKTWYKKIWKKSKKKAADKQKMQVVAL